MLKDSFLKYLLLERNYSEKTILSYGIDLDEFEADRQKALYRGLG